MISIGLKDCAKSRVEPHSSQNPPLFLLVCERIVLILEFEYFYSCVYNNIPTMQDKRKLAAIHIKKQYEILQKESDINVSVGLIEGDMFKWRLCIEGPTGTPFQEGLYQATLDFPNDFPYMPPKMVFQTEMFHPNIYPNGEVCISILHAPVEDVFNPQEKMTEKWNPVLTIEAVLVSVLSMLVDPNLESPANVDASVLYKNNKQGYNKKIRELAQKSIEG